MCAEGRLHGCWNSDPCAMEMPDPYAGGVSSCFDLYLQLADLMRRR